jgi:hypothetical protein
LRARRGWITLFELITLYSNFLTVMETCGRIRPRPSERPDQPTTLTESAIPCTTQLTPHIFSLRFSSYQGYLPLPLTLSYISQPNKKNYKKKTTKSKKKSWSNSPTTFPLSKHHPTLLILPIVYPQHLRSNSSRTLLSNISYYNPTILRFPFSWVITPRRSISTRSLTVYSKVRFSSPC